MPGAALDGASDRALARRAGLGETAAFEELFHRLFPPTFRYALHMLDGDVPLAEDAVQDAWAKAWRALAGFRGGSTVQTWLFRIVANEVLDVRRRSRPIVVDPFLLDGAEGQPSSTVLATGSESVAPDRVLMDRELWEAAKLALSELPWRQRASWLLREMEGFSYTEIADVLGTTPTVVRGQLHRARAALAIRMEQWR